METLAWGQRWLIIILLAIIAIILTDNTPHNVVRLNFRAKQRSKTRESEGGDLDEKAPSLPAKQA